VDGFSLLRRLCIFIATDEIYFAHGETFNHRIIALLPACTRHSVCIIMCFVS
jgi:hypothetical protein